ncbi:deoxyribodipyrimidine photo-lyase [Frigidibacter sp. RF13]|uniref:cryptochrome/photolyase family protein n=1 Tax=Frigidibacter sp. RF13 TaxID=2997340 RepID=UPI00226E8E74|nr:deoxyribodipyrimidine photo-lyase [Frigidibacter sp. RF13]MCY1125879.1 deoxyribodipyrimidine photo-lyase [Frigidibacter sp. RF13]
MADQAPVIVWFRRDLRLDDHPALAAAAETGRPIVPLFIHDETVEVLGAAPRYRLGLGLAAFAAALERRGLRLILRRGRALEVLKALVAETGARAVHWTRYYEPAHIARDRQVKSWAAASAIEARSFPGALLHEPTQILTQAGHPYSVFTPFWRRLRQGPVPAPEAVPPLLRPPATWPASDELASWKMDAPMNRGAAILRPHIRPGEAAALERLSTFLEEKLHRYADRRDFPTEEAASGLSDHLAWGEISPRRIWAEAMARKDHDAALDSAAEKFLSELGWRDFAWHLMYHNPTLATENWRKGWEAFPWRRDNEDAARWRRGMTGVPFVDAGMREMYVTGRMHNRVRMVAASYLTKHLLTDWRVGLAWFADCLTDWDPASNALGWQWVAGSGPDAAPYFRIFNPDAQADRFDPERVYCNRFLGEGRDGRGAFSDAYFDAVPRWWNLDRATPYPKPIIEHSAGRARALSAYEHFRGQ